MRQVAAGIQLDLDAKQSEIPMTTGTGPTHRGRVVILREERSGEDSRHLWAYLDAEGALHIDGQDLGPGTAMVSDDGEYEWFRTVRAEHLRALLTELGGNEEDDVLDLLAERYCGQASYDLERRLHESRLPIELLVD